MDTLFHTQNNGWIDTVIISASDHDWYEIGTSTAPDDITDNIWTDGWAAVGIAGTTTSTINDTLLTALIVDGNILPDVDQAYDVGTRVKRWQNIWAVNGKFSLSDRRYKENITSIEYGLEEIMKLDPVTYFWKNKDVSAGRKVGLIAQDVHLIIPEVVDTGDHTSDLMSIDYAGIVPVLVRAIQEQQDIIDRQQSQIEALKAESVKSTEVKSEFDLLKTENSALKDRLDEIEEFLRHLRQNTNKE